MAKKDTEFKTEPMQSVEELNRRLLEKQLENAEAEAEVRSVSLETQKVQLEEAKESAEAYRQKKADAKRRNEERERGFQSKATNDKTAQKQCEHRSGGWAGETSLLEGDGPSVLHVTIFPDQVTEFIQCTRCQLKIFGRPRSQAEEAKMAEAAAVANGKFGERHPDVIAWENHLWWKQLREQHRRTGYKKSVMRGPTFTFKTLDGMPVVPEPTVPLKQQIRRLAG